jgi:hypothetical protein
MNGGASRKAPALTEQTDKPAARQEIEMSDSHALPLGDAEGSGGRGEEIRWVTVAQTMGLMQAQIMVGRLQAEGIPARAWQEGAGEALGLTVGILGTGHVVVPEAFEDEAEAILAQEFEEEDEDDR